LFKEAKVTFNRPLGETEIREFFYELGQKLESRISYTIEKREETGEMGIEEEEKRTRLQSVKINGRIIPNIDFMKQGAILCPFDCYRDIHSDDDFIKASGMQFFVPPGYDSHEIPSGEKKIWEIVREFSKNYFSMHPDERMS